MASPFSLASASVVLVDSLDEARQLLSGGTNGADRLVVVHPHRAEQADRSERSVREAVGRAHQRGVLQRRMVELAADAHPRAQRIERLAQEREQRSAALERDEDVAVEAELIVPRV